VDADKDEWGVEMRGRMGPRVGKSRLLSIYLGELSVGSGRM
jgi:hypothetical protein